jgi:acylphosphatase
MAYRLIVEGIVQGVGCRHYLSRYGRELGLHGSASNQPDGTVEVILKTDDRDMVERYKSEVEENRRNIPFAGRIGSITVEENYQGPLFGDYTF